MESSRSGGQDGWIGTGSVVKVKGKYYFFYTGHSSAPAPEYRETIMVAQSDDPTSFTRKEGWRITPPAELNQKNDFRDPQAYYDEKTDKITLTVTAAKDGNARVLKYTLDGDLTNAVYDGVIFTDMSGKFWNLECTDTFKLGDKWYLTYSAQDDTLWYAAADDRYGPYSAPRRMEGKLFYAAKHVENGKDLYMVGWARRSESVSSTQDVNGWAGNLAVQKLALDEKGGLILVPLDGLEKLFSCRRALQFEGTRAKIEAASSYSYTDAFMCYERFMVQGMFTFTGDGTFGLAFDYNKRAEKYKMIRFNPSSQAVELVFNEGDTFITEVKTELVKGKEYSFTYVQDGSVGIMYIDGQCALTVRLYGASGKAVKLFAENNTVSFTALRQYTA